MPTSHGKQTVFFYFVNRDTVLTWQDEMPRMQKLRNDGQLVGIHVDLVEAFEGRLQNEILFVSHRWEKPAKPDTTGSQLREIQDYLRRHPNIKLVWYDYSCIPQWESETVDGRTREETAQVAAMLKAMADLYLTVRVLVLLDTTYCTRFWTLMEAWCSMKSSTVNGLTDATKDTQRCEIACIHNASHSPSDSCKHLYNMVQNRTPEQMYINLTYPDVLITNADDKDIMLPVVLRTDEHVRKMMELVQRKQKVTQDWQLVEPSLKSTSVQGKWNKALILRDRLFWNHGGEDTALTECTDQHFKMIFNGVLYEARLGTDGKLHWDDGDVWIREASGGYHQPSTSGHQQVEDLYFSQGQHVQYYSENRKQWFDTRVQAVRADGAIQLELKPTDWFEYEAQKRCVRVKRLQFIDTDGNVSVIQVSDTRKMVWTVQSTTISNNDRTVEHLIVSTRDAERGQYSISGPFGLVLLIEPVPGPAQKQLIRQLCHTATVQGVPISAAPRNPTEQISQPAPAIFTVGQQVEYYSLRKEAWFSCKIKSVEVDKVEIDIKPGYWFAGTELSMNIRGTGQDPSSSQALERADSKPGSHYNCRWQLVEKEGFLGPVSGEHDIPAFSEEEARKMVLSNPDTYIGYTVHCHHDSLIWVRKVGSPFIKTELFKSYLASCPTINYKGKLFEDCYTTNRSIFMGGLEHGKGHGPYVVWKRPGRGEGLYDRGSLMLWSEIDPNGVHQGSVGDTSLIAAIASLAEFPWAIKRLFSCRSGEPSKQGKYTITLFDWRKKGWKCFEIDDRFATRTADDHEPLFAKASEQYEIYPMLLEKAVAIMLGGFDYMSAIMPTWALSTLTGCVDVWMFQCRAGQWTGSRPVYDGTSTYEASTVIFENAWPDGKNGREPKTNREMFEYLHHWDRQHCLMCCGCAALGMTNSALNPSGISYVHTYSLLEVRKNVAGSGKNLLKCRNSHGAGGQEPDLKWKDHDPLWDQYPQVKAELIDRYGFQADGLFWLEEDDFFGPNSCNFNTVYVLKCSMKG